MLQVDSGTNDLSTATIGQLLIPVSDLDRAIAFYRDALGLRLLFTAPPQMSFFQAGEVRLLVAVPEGTQDMRSSMIYFRVPDIHAVAQHIESRGVELLHQPHVVHRTPTSELWLCEFADPDGNKLALMEDRNSAPTPQ
jgi:methylmalonyl-CoA/ethylmalonyl-CoA epimerase